QAFTGLRFHRIWAASADRLARSSIRSKYSNSRDSERYYTNDSPTSGAAPSRKIRAGWNADGGSGFTVPSAGLSRSAGRGGDAPGRRPRAQGGPV
ncbi:unnamed protein product, partial [Nesidiocoris tenuis]